MQHWVTKIQIIIFIRLTRAFVFTGSRRNAGTLGCFFLTYPKLPPSSSRFCPVPGLQGHLKCNDSLGSISRWTPSAELRTGVCSHQHFRIALRYPLAKSWLFHLQQLDFRLATVISVNDIICLSTVEPAPHYLWDSPASPGLISQL